MGKEWVKNLPANQETQEAQFRPLVLGRSPGIGNNNQLQYSCLENSKDKGTWRSIDAKIVGPQVSD